MSTVPAADARAGARPGANVPLQRETQRVRDDRDDLVTRNDHRGAGPATGRAD
jgi:hypothetical protein